MMVELLLKLYGIPESRPTAWGLKNCQNFWKTYIEWALEEIKFHKIQNLC